MTRILLLFLLMPLCFPVEAQQSDSLSVPLHVGSFFEKGDLKHFSFGVFSGVNYGHLKGDLQMGKWEKQGGPSTGVYIDYALSRFFSIHTEMLYQRLYYHYKNYNEAHVGRDPGPVLHTMESGLRSVFPYPARSEDSRYWNFSFYRIPMQVQFHTPTRLRFSLAGGVVFSFLDQYGQSGASRSYYPLLSSYAPLVSSSMYYAPYLRQEKDDLPQHDWGMMYSAGLSYTVAEHLQLAIAGRFYAGHRVFMDGLEGKAQVPEWIFKMGYSGISHPDGNAGVRENVASVSKLLIKYRAGLLLSNHRGNQFQSSYASQLGPSAGVSFDWQFDPHFSLEAGLSYNRKGYHLKDSSISSFRFLPSRMDHLAVETDTRIDLDYLMIPLMLNLRFGEPLTFYMQGGFYHGFLINARSQGTRLEENTSGDEYRRSKISVCDHMEGYIRGNDWGWIAGAGIRLPLTGSYKLELGLRYDQSLINNYKSLSNSSIFGDRAFFNESVKWSVGLQVPIY